MQWRIFFHDGCWLPSADSWVRATLPNTVPESLGEARRFLKLFFFFPSDSTLNEQRKTGRMGDRKGCYQLNIQHHWHTIVMVHIAFTTITFSNNQETVRYDRQPLHLSSHLFYPSGRQRPIYKIAHFRPRVSSASRSLES